MSAGCLFCRLLKGELPATRIGETPRTVAILDAFPVSPGHALILTREHFETMDQVPMETLKELGLEAGRLSDVLVKTMGYAGTNLLANSGAVAGQTVGHVHWHVFGRRPGDGILSFHSGPKADPSYFAETARKMKP